MESTDILPKSNHFRETLLQDSYILNIILITSSFLLTSKILWNIIFSNTFSTFPEYSTLRIIIWTLPIKAIPLGGHMDITRELFFTHLTFHIGGISSRFFEGEYWKCFKDNTDHPRHDIIRFHTFHNYLQFNQNFHPRFSPHFGESVIL